MKKITDTNKIQIKPGDGCTLAIIDRNLEIGADDITIFFNEINKRMPVAHVLRKGDFEIFRLPERLKANLVIQLSKRLHVNAGLVYDGEKMRKKKLRKQSDYHPHYKLEVPEKFSGFYGNLITGYGLEFIKC
jgi:hypothetical protein